MSKPTSTPTSAASKNVLDQETSPYLLQHRDNPVHWQPWGPKALARAEAENKPILLSIGYAACHWCHVMAHESFENDAIAQHMNDGFINIKVDREERPDLDIIYQTALGLMGEQGGWPLTMFLNSAGEPFWGGTYFPSTPKYGRPGFTSILERVVQVYQEDRASITQSAEALRDAISKLSHTEGAGGLSMAQLDRAAELNLTAIDLIHGGTEGAPKFPMTAFFQFLWRSSRRTQNPQQHAAVITTLDRMCQGGIYDHVGGGFSRYSTDEVWLAPHFEKMLYDNALLIDLLCEVWRDTASPLYAARIRETIDWTLDRMRTGNARGHGGPGGHVGPQAFASAYDADSEGVEGKYYVWSEAEIDDLLGDDAVPFKAAYDVSESGNWEHANILNRSKHGSNTAPVGELADGATEALLAVCRRVLLGVRDKRVSPLWDDKVLADWNGMMIAALARAGAAFGAPEWIHAAREAFDFVCSEMTENGRLRHAWRDGRAQHSAVLDDYAHMSRAALALYEVTADAAYLEQAKAWVATADARYWDSDGGGYFFTADDAESLIARSKTIADNAVPSGNGIMADVLVRLHLVTGEAGFGERADTLFKIFSSDTPSHLTNTTSLLTAFELSQTGLQIVIIGGESSEGGGTEVENNASGSGTEAKHSSGSLFAAAARSAPGAAVITRVDGATPLASTHPAFGKEAIDGAATAYVCAGQTCGLPHTDADSLERELGRQP